MNRMLQKLAKVHESAPGVGRIDLDWVIPEGGLERAAAGDIPAVVVLQHGLSGSSHSDYVVHMVEEMCRREPDWFIVVLHGRGCAMGSDPLKFPVITNASTTADFAFVGHYVRAIVGPDVPVFATGFSLGANILAKTLGEMGDQCPFNAAAIVSAPFDCSMVSASLARWVPSLVYQGSLVGGLRDLVKRNASAFRDSIDLEHVMASSTVEQFDERLVIKLANYPSTKYYYDTASSLPVLDRIAIPTLLLHAVDDPVTPLPEGGLPLSPTTMLVATEHGGHVSHLETITGSSFADRLVTAWFQKQLRPHLPIRI
jgi:predicted alpha/beta-fold hydrolase